MENTTANFDTLHNKAANSTTDARTADQKNLSLDFQNTAIAFAHKSDKELKQTALLFQLMNKPTLVKFGSKVGNLAVKLRLPFSERAVMNTIFKQFCGGRTLLESQKTINHLYAHNVLSVLDYGAEGKQSEEDFNLTMNEVIRGIEFAATNESVPVVSTKLTGMARFALLEKISAGQSLTAAEEKEYKVVRKRVDSICHVARENAVAIFFDAEESWIQQAIDDLIEEMMRRYNKEKAIVYGTYQMYRHDRLDYLKASFERAKRDGYLLGAKLVRGAYMNKERQRATEKGYPSPINENKQATDDLFNEGIKFCVDHYEQIASCNASHNAKSCMLQAHLIQEKRITTNHPHLNFCQLLGMSDNLTFNLAEAGFNVAKYMVYGPVRDVLPYLVRRAEENTSITGDMSRELGYIMTEIKRRGLK